MNFEKLCTTTSIAKTVYMKFTSNTNVLTKPRTKWAKEFGKVITSEEFEQVYRNVHLTTNVAKFRSFQYRLLHRAVITNIQMAHWGLVKNHYCTFCEKEPETYLHLFVYCDYVKSIWIKMEEYMLQISEQPINFTEETVIFNKLIANPANVKNFICLVVKQYIYRKRCFKEYPEVHEIINQIRNIESIEKCNARKNNNIVKHTKKWKDYRDHAISQNNFVNQFIINM